MNKIFIILILLSCWTYSFGQQKGEMEISLSIPYGFQKQAFGECQFKK